MASSKLPFTNNCHWILLYTTNIVIQDSTMSNQRCTCDQNGNLISWRVSVAWVADFKQHKVNKGRSSVEQSNASSSRFDKISGWRHYIFSSSFPASPAQARPRQEQVLKGEERTIWKVNCSDRTRSIMLMKSNGDHWTSSAIIQQCQVYVLVNKTQIFIYFS